MRDEQSFIVDISRLAYLVCHNVPNLISLANNCVHNMAKYISMILSHAFPSYQIGLKLV